jgi:hypothetical protein
MTMMSELVSLRLNDVDTSEAGQAAALGRFTLFGTKTTQNSQKNGCGHKKIHTRC